MAKCLYSSSREEEAKDKAKTATEDLENLVQEESTSVEYVKKAPC